MTHASDNSSKCKVALSACLAGKNCRYNGEIKGNETIIKYLENNGYEIIIFCPEDKCFGTPREAMDLIQTDRGVCALGKFSGEDKTSPIADYAEEFFNENTDIDLFIGKARSPSCGVRTAKLYDLEENLLSDNETGIMASSATARGIEAVDDEEFISTQLP